MPEPCGICLPQTQSTVTRLVHQNSGFHSWELITKTRNMEIRSLKTVLGHKVLFPLGTPCRALTRGACGAAVPLGTRRVLAPGLAARDTGTRKWLKETSGHGWRRARHRRFRHPSFLSTATAGQDTLSLWNEMLGYTLVCPPDLLSLHRAQFCLCGYPKMCRSCPNSGGGCRDVRTPQTWSWIELLCHSNFAGLFPWNGEFVHLRLEMGVTRSLSCLKPVLTGGESSKHLSKRGSCPGRWSPSPLEPLQFVSLLNHKGWTLFSFHAVPWTGL